MTMVTLSDNAAAALAQAITDRNIPGFALRVQIVGGGCEGFLYDLVFTDEVDAGDAVFERSGVRVVVDPKTLAAIRGLVIDLESNGFVFSNPQARNKCSCGASFSL